MSLKERMKYLQKAYSLIRNGVNHKDHIMKAHLDYATKEAFTNGMGKFEIESGNDNQSLYNMQFNNISERFDKWDSSFEWVIAKKRNESINRANKTLEFYQEQGLASRNLHNLNDTQFNKVDLIRTNEERSNRKLIDISKHIYEEGNVLP